MTTEFKSLPNLVLVNSNDPSEALVTVEKVLTDSSDTQPIRLHVLGSETWLSRDDLLTLAEQIKAVFG